MDRPDTELTLDGADQGGTLEQRTGQGLEGARELGLAAGDLVVEADDAEVLLSGALLGLDQPSGAVNARGVSTGVKDGLWITRHTKRSGTR